MFGKLHKYLQLMRYFELHGHLPIWRQCFEMLIIYLVRGIGPGYYLVGRFGRHGIPLSDKLGYFNHSRYRKQISKLNNSMFSKLSQHKVAEAALLDYFSIPSPRSLGFYHPAIGRDRGGMLLRNAIDLSRLIENEKVSRLVIKPCQGFGGTGVRVVESLGDGLLRLLEQENVMSVKEFTDRFLNSSNGYLLQEYFQQHPDLAKFNPSSVNTVRVLVYRPEDQAAVCIGAFLRMGRQGALVDNGSNGGLLANINLETGKVGSGYFFKPSAEFYDSHPDSAAKIKGSTIPMWQKAKELSVSVLDCFFEIRFAGIDVAFGPDGPVIIELNVEPDYGDFAVLNIPSMKVLSV